MKKLLTKLRRFWRKQPKKAAALCAGTALLLVVMLARVAMPGIAHAVYVGLSYSYDAFYPGQYTHIYVYGSNADSCFVEYYYSWGSPPISGQRCGSGGCSTQANGNYVSAYVGPLNSPATYRVGCTNYGPENSGYNYADITLYPSCAASSFGSPWNSNSYLIYSGGRGSVSNWYGRYCLTNYSGSAIYIPMATPTEWNNFVSRASAIGIGITSY